MNLSKRDQTQLWQSLATGNRALFYTLTLVINYDIDRWDEFWAVNRQLVEYSNSSLRNIPLRIYLPDNCPVIQELIPFYGESGKHCVKHSITWY